MCEPRGELWRDRSLGFHHDNAPAHSSLRVAQLLAGKDTSAMDHPPYAPDLAPAHFWLFPELKNVLKAKCFSDVGGIKSCEKNDSIPVQDRRRSQVLCPQWPRPMAVGRLQFRSRLGFGQMKWRWGRFFPSYLVFLTNYHSTECSNSCRFSQRAPVPPLSKDFNKVMFHKTCCEQGSSKAEPRIFVQCIGLWFFHVTVLFSQCMGRRPLAPVFSSLSSAPRMLSVVSNLWRFCLLLCTE
jgi:hypothetical protein